MAPTAAGFDACTVGFGIRNVPDIVRAFREMRGCAGPGAGWCAWRSPSPASRCSSSSTTLWFDRIVPVLGRLAAGDSFAYSYLPASVRRFPDPDELAELMEEAGLGNVRYEILAGGIIALHHALV